MKSWYAYHALMNLDNNCEQYIQKYANSVVSTNIMKTSELSETKLKGENDRSRKSSSKMTLQEAIEKGLRDDAGKITTDMIATEAPLDIINEELIPALNHVGDGFEKGTVFLPQLLMSAEAAKSAFSVLKEKMEKAVRSEKKRDESFWRP